MTTPANLTAHDWLIANGYVYTYNCDFEDVGDTESGPHLIGGEWDEYESAEDRVFVNHYDGHADFQMRNFDEEAYFEQMEKAYSTAQSHMH